MNLNRLNLKRNRLAMCLYIVFSYVRTRIEITLVYLKQKFMYLVLCNKIEINIRFSLCYVLIVNES